MKPRTEVLPELLRYAVCQWWPSASLLSVAAVPRAQDLPGQTGSFKFTIEKVFWPDLKSRRPCAEALAEVRDGAISEQTYRR